jgi:DNA replication protein DnaC
MATRMSIDVVLSEYKKRRDIFQIKSDHIVSELIKKYPKLLALRKKYAALRANERKNKSNGYSDKYKAVYKEYNEYLADCLKKENISQSEIEYQPLCKKCNDTGYLGDDYKRYCSCVISKAAQNMLENSNINDKETLQNFCFDIFSDSILEKSRISQKEMMQKIHGYITEWVNNFPSCSKKQMLIAGNVGLGKSYLLNAIAYAILNRGFSAMMVSSFAINEAAFSEIKNSDSNAIAMMKNVDVLLVDDLGSEQVLNKITIPTLFNILNERTRKNLATVVSTNLSAEQIEAIYGLRIFSRLINKDRTQMFLLRGKDIRKK